MKAIFYILIMIFFYGCASSQPQGPIFAGHKEFSQEKALVYIYRKGDESGGYDRTYGLKANNEAITILKHGGYFPYIVNPGQIEFVADVIYSPAMFVAPIATAIEEANKEGAGKQTLNVEAGKIYYLQFYPIEHFTYYELRFKVNDKDVGEADLKACKLLEAYTAQK
jgi:hypothetical protein